MFKGLIRKIDLSPERPHEYNGSCFEAKLRYKFASDYIDRADNLMILDVGCGEGYGLDFLLKKSKIVIGIDYSRDAIAIAKDKFANEANIFFITMNAVSLGFRNGTFDVVCAFEVLEHLEKPKDMLREIKRVLKHEGAFILTTPNRIYWDKVSSEIKSPFHVKEFAYGELKEMLEEYFVIDNFSGIFFKGRKIETTSFFKIYMKIKRFLRLKDWRASERLRKMLLREPEKYCISNKNLQNCLYFLVICRNRNNFIR